MCVEICLKCIPSISQTIATLKEKTSLRNKWLKINVTNLEIDHLSIGPDKWSYFSWNKKIASIYRCWCIILWYLDRCPICSPNMYVSWCDAASCNANLSSQPCIDPSRRHSCSHCIIRRVKINSHSRSFYMLLREIAFIRVLDKILHLRLNILLRYFS